MDSYGKIKCDDWYGCYKEMWGEGLCQDSYSHPAKVNRGLARKIYAHVIERGWLKAGDICLDPFAGIGGFAIDAMYYGLHWVGVELEEKFVALGQQNIDLWNSRYSALPRWGSAVILQGDSRQLCDVLAGAVARGLVSSPPYSTGKAHPSIGSVNKDDWGHEGRDIAGRRGLSGDYSPNPANLGNLPAGDWALVSSPPYAGSAVSLAKGMGKRQIENLKRAVERGENIGREGLRMASGGRHGAGNQLTRDTGQYGTTPGQLAAMPEGVGLVSSPPYAKSNVGNDDAENELKRLQKKAAAGQLKGEHLRLVLQGRLSPHEQAAQAGYSPNPANLGNLSAGDGETFWSAARQIVSQCYQVLGPDSVAIFVTKRFVRGGKIVQFSKQWAALCESCGFEVIEWIRAWLIEDRGAQYALNGDLEERTRKRASFFRRLYESKYPENSIDWEDVIIMRRV